MPLYARSDLSSVFVPVESGGCGQHHSRPVVDGAPVGIWSFSHDDCEGCANFLAQDAHWSGTLSGIPETPDEKLAREDAEKRGAQDQAKANSVALEQLARLGDLPGA